MYVRMHAQPLEGLVSPIPFITPHRCPNRRIHSILRARVPSQVGFLFPRKLISICSLTTLVPRSAEASGILRVGDRLIATSASMGEQMWPKSTLEGALAAINTRFALSPSVRLRFTRVNQLGPWASELCEISEGGRLRLSREATRSLRSQWRDLRASPSVSPELCSALRNISLPAVRAVLRSRDRRRGIPRQPLDESGVYELVPSTRHSSRVRADSDARSLRTVLRVLRRCRVGLDCTLTHLLMKAALRCGDAPLALLAFEQLTEGGGVPDTLVYTALVRVHAALGQRAEAIAVLQRMRADEVAPSVETFNAAMTVCAADGDKQGMLDHFAMIRKEGFTPGVASWNIVLNFCANRKGVDVEQVITMRSSSSASHA